MVASPATSTSQNTPRSINMIDHVFGESTTFPTPLFRWSIHYDQPPYEAIKSPPRSPPAHIDLDDEESWPAWPASSSGNDITQRLDHGLERNTFSNVRPSELPIATDQIVRAVKQSPQEILQEALGFSIMSRNQELTEDLLVKITKSGYQIRGLYPFHLAIAYLDGSKSCCNILDELTREFPIRQYYVNDLGHTVLDGLMIAILKSHTSCTPIVADSFFKNEKRFEGAEVDVCGRWDADSPCVRELLAKGDSSIPFGWKHMFCHTSAQAICHSMESLDLPFTINKPSGLFVRRCYHCGLKLQLLPLHCLVMVGFHLSLSGCENENLFGILACLLCLLSNGADPRLKAEISLQSLWGDQDGDRCAHEELDPIELVENLMASFASTWCEEIATAWNVIVYVLRQSRAEWNGEPCPKTTGTASKVNDLVGYSNEELNSDNDEELNSDNDEELKSNNDEEIGTSLPARCSCHDKGNYFGRRRSLATLLAAVTTELLTYRRLTVTDAWLSQNFDMTSLNRGLNQEDNVAIPLVERKMMKSYCDCGLFVDAKCNTIATTEETCAFYFSNMEDWNRTSFIYLDNEI